MASNELTEKQVKVLEMVKVAGVVDSMCMYRAHIAIAEGLAKRGLLVKGKGFKTTYRLA